MSILKEVRSHYGKLNLFINGEVIESESSEVYPVMNPAKDETIAKVPFATKEEVDIAVKSAAEAFERWKELPITTRIRYIFKMRNLMEAHFEEIARITTQNHGKIISESRGEVRRLVENIESACAVAYSLSKGENMDQIASGIDETLIREPLGVFAIICPFNFPAMVPFWFLPYAVVLGCPVIVKPSEITPIATDWAFKIMKELNLPPGVINMVHGSKEVVERLVTHPKIKGITFVGSTRVGSYLYKLAGEHGKRAIIQAGAKNFIVVMPDADLEKTIPALLTSFYGNTGQRCLSGANLVAVGDVYEKLKEKFVKAASELKIGYGLDESVEMGPVTTKKARERIIGYIEKGIEEGAKLILDGRKVEVKGYPNGYFLGPSIFDNVTPDMVIARDEIFGPVANILRTENLEEAIEIINESNYGNAACIFTSSGKWAREFRRKVEAGNIGINIGIAAPMAFFPFAGRKESFFGVLHGQIDSVDFFTDKKVVITRWW